MSKDKEESRGRSFNRKLASVISGSASGAVVSITLQPLDVIRTQLQASAGSEGKGLAKGVFTTAREIWACGGLKAFWRGSDPTFWRLSVGLGIQMLTLETVTDALIKRRHHTAVDATEGDQGRELGKLEAFLSGGLARGVAAAATVPFTIAKTRMEYQGPNAYAYKNTYAALKSIVQTEGGRGVFRGIGPTILTNAPFSALYYMFYSDIKRRLQPLGNSSMNARLGVLAIMRAIINLNGPKALLAGALPRVLKRTLQTALVWTLYEELKPLLMKQYAELQTEREEH